MFGQTKTRPQAGFLLGDSRGIQYTHMDFDEYQRQSAATDTTTGDEDQRFRMMYFSMGLAGETGEVVEKLKKVVRNDGGELSQEKKSEIAKELGDVLWYLSQLASLVDHPFSKVAELNIQKLSDRKDRGVIKSEGDNR